MKSKQERCEHMVISHKHTHVLQKPISHAIQMAPAAMLLLCQLCLERYLFGFLTKGQRLWLSLGLKFPAALAKFALFLRVTFLFSCHQTTSLNPINFIAGRVHLLSPSFSSFRRSLVHQQWSSIRLPPLISWLFMSNDETIVQPVFMIVTSRFINLTIE